MCWNTLIVSCGIPHLLVSLRSAQWEWSVHTVWGEDGALYQDLRAYWLYVRRALCFVFLWVVSLPSRWVLLLTSTVAVFVSIKYTRLLSSVLQLDTSASFRVCSSNLRCVAGVVFVTLRFACVWPSWIYLVSCSFGTDWGLTHFVCQCCSFVYATSAWTLVLCYNRIRKHLCLCVWFTGLGTVCLGLCDVPSFCATPVICSCRFVGTSLKMQLVRSCRHTDQPFLLDQHWWMCDVLV